MSTRPLWRRRKIVVNHKLQLRFTAVLMLQMTVLLGVLGVLVCTHVNRTAAIALEFPFVDSTSRVLLQQDFLDNVQGFYARSLVLMAVTAITVVLFGLLASHKIAGPALKLQTFLATLGADGFTQRISFRKDDYLDDFAAHINAMTDAIAQRRSQAEEVAREFAAKADLLDQGEHSQFVVEADRLVAEYRATI